MGLVVAGQSCRYSDQDTSGDNHLPAGGKPKHRQASDFAEDFTRPYSISYHAEGTVIVQVAILSASASATPGHQGSAFPD